MKAKIQPRISLDNRTKLETVIPLSTPYLLFIDPSDVCNRRCEFCPTGNYHLVRKFRQPQIMSWDLFKGLVEDLQEFPEKIKTVRLYKDGEPLLNPAIDLMVALLKRKNVAERVDLTTNGMLLVPSFIENLVKAGLDAIFISVPQNYTDEYLDMIKYFYNHKEQCEMRVKIVGDGLSDEDKQIFMDDFGDHCDYIFIENLAPCWPNFEVKISGKGIYDNPVSDVDVCPYIFYSMSVNSDGTVSACFLDWSRTLIIGDANNESLVNIWNGENMKALRTFMLHGIRREMPFCRNCGQLKYGAPDNIDPYKDKLLKRIG
jgi:MoaA/NifB/PqqE/SkfB family radical SAM enzyme